MEKAKRFLKRLKVKKKYRNNYSPTGSLPPSPMGSPPPPGSTLRRDRSMKSRSTFSLNRMWRRSELSSCNCYSYRLYSKKIKNRKYPSIAIFNDLICMKIGYVEE